VLTAMESDQCGVDFEPGRTYLIYARNLNGQLYTDIFSTFAWDPHSERVDWLKNRKSQPPAAHQRGEEKIAAYKRNDFKLVLDKKQKLKLDGEPLIYDNSTYVPLSLFAKSLGYKANWDANRHQILLFSKQKLGKIQKFA
jgi:hypothetical protein